MKEKALPIIAIDGPAGCGKTSLAHALAAELGRPYLDTGAMFRFVALKLGPQALTLPEPILKEKLEALSFNLKDSGKDTTLLCNGEAGGQNLRTEEISRLASQLAALPPVREKLRLAQQKLGHENALVAEGRDMGTVVFPLAALKIFVDASPATRALRRHRQLMEAGIDSSLAELEKSIAERDERDRSRKAAPLLAAPDAIVINTDSLPFEAVLAKIRSLALQKRNELKLPPDFDQS